PLANLRNPSISTRLPALSLGEDSEGSDWNGRENRNLGTTSLATDQFARQFLFWLDPLAMLADEIHEPIHCLRFRDVELNGLLAHVDVDLACSAADVTKLRIRHFTWSVYDTAHHCNLHAFEMLRPALDACRDRLQVEQSAPARRTGHIIGLE